MCVEWLPVPEGKLSGKRVLVVEDEALVAMLLEGELRDAGAEVVRPACSLGEALGLIDRSAADGGFSAAVLGINLQGTAVGPVADRLAALGVPFLFVTGYREDFDRGAHAAPVLPKPFDPEWLVAAVGTLASPPRRGTGAGRTDRTGNGRAVAQERRVA